MGFGTGFGEDELYIFTTEVLIPFQSRCLVERQLPAPLLQHCVSGLQSNLYARETELYRSADGDEEEED
jgi:hypothetical protein